MIEKEDFQKFLSAFPELKHTEAEFRKEILAHFGLVFSSFADLEASLQMLFIHTELLKDIRSKKLTNETEWEVAFDAYEAKAHRATMGTLVNLISHYPEIAQEFLSELGGLKDQHNHFAHHFFREELPTFYSDDAILEALYEMHRLRFRIEEARLEADRNYNVVLRKLYPTVDFESRIAEAQNRLEQEFMLTKRAKISWERKRET